MTDSTTITYGYLPLMFAALACHYLHKSLCTHTQMLAIAKWTQLTCVGRQLCHSVYWTVCQRKIPAEEERYLESERKVKYFRLFTGAVLLILNHWLHRWLWSQSAWNSHSWNQTALAHAKENPPWAQNESHRVAFLSQIHTRLVFKEKYTLTLLHCCLPE